MKFLGNLFTVVGVIMLGVVGVLAQSEKAVITAIRDVTDKSADLQVVVSELTISNFPSKGLKIAAGLNDIASNVREFIEVLGGSADDLKTRDTEVFPNGPAEEIVEVLTGFVEVHQLLLNTIIGKHSLAARFFLTAPIAAALRGLESVVDSFAFLLIGLIPTQENNAELEFSQLTVTFTEAISTYRK